MTSENTVLGIVIIGIIIPTMFSVPNFLVNLTELEIISKEQIKSFIENFQVNNFENYRILLIFMILIPVSVYVTLEFS